MLWVLNQASAWFENGVEINSSFWSFLPQMTSWTHFWSSAITSRNTHTHTHRHMIHELWTLGEFMGVCELEISHKHASDFQRLWIYDHCNRRIKPMIIEEMRNKVVKTNKKVNLTSKINFVKFLVIHTDLCLKQFFENSIISHTAPRHSAVKHACYMLQFPVTDSDRYEPRIVNSTLLAAPIHPHTQQSLGFQPGDPVGQLWRDPCPKFLTAREERRGVRHVGSTQTSFIQRHILPNLGQFLLQKL